MASSAVTRIITNRVNLERIIESHQDLHFQRVTYPMWEHNLSQTQTNLNNQWGQKKRSQSELKLKTIKLPEARENANDRFAIGLSVEFDWFRKRGEYSTPSHSEAEQTLRNPAIISILD